MRPSHAAIARAKVRSGSVLWAKDRYEARARADAPGMRMRSGGRVRTRRRQRMPFPSARKGRQALSLRAGPEPADHDIGGGEGHGGCLAALVDQELPAERAVDTVNDELIARIGDPVEFVGAGVTRNPAALKYPTARRMWAACVTRTMCSTPACLRMAAE